jgi:hypothetical protein
MKEGITGTEVYVTDEETSVEFSTDNTSPHSELGIFTEYRRTAKLRHKATVLFKDQSFFMELVGVAIIFLAGIRDGLDLNTSRYLAVLTDSFRTRSKQIPLPPKSLSVRYPSFISSFYSQHRQITH